MEGLLGEQSWHSHSATVSPDVCRSRRSHAWPIGWPALGPGRSDQPVGRTSLAAPVAAPALRHPAGAASGGGHAEGAARLADHLLGEAPFVVVPGHHLDQRGVHDPGQLQVDDGGARVANDVGGDQRIL
jgi:hypothetical protein